MICLPIGTRVKICQAGVDGVITAITLRFQNNVEYEVSYWWNGEYKHVWLESYSFAVVASEEQTKIGFK